MDDPRNHNEMGAVRFAMTMYFRVHDSVADCRMVNYVDIYNYVLANVNN